MRHLPSRVRRRGVALAVLVALLAAACSSGDSALNSGESGESDESAETSSVGTAATAAPETDAAADTASAGSAVDEPADTEPAPTEPPAPSTTEAPLAQFPPCPVDALDTADGPIDVVFWHAMVNDVEDVLIELTDAYNAGQDRVRVELQNQTSYGASVDKYIQLGADSRPDLIQLPEYVLQVMGESDTFVPAGACLEAGGLDTSTFIERTLSAYDLQGVQWAMPFNVSNPVLFYNKLMFAEAGLDPEDPPLTLEELRAASEALVSSGAAGVGLVLDSGADSGGSWFLEQWFGRLGEAYADNGNGRLAPATQVLFDDESGVELMTFLQDMINDGLAVSVGDNPGGQDAFLKMIDPDQPAAMTVGTSAALGPVIAALGSGIGGDLTTDDVGVGAMPGPSDEASVQVGGASLWLPAGKADEVAAAAWDFVTYLTSADVQSTWASRTGFVPVREDAIEIPPLSTTYAEDPRFAVPYEQILARADDPTANAPVLGPMREVRAETASAAAAIFGGADVAAQLAAAAEQSNLLIESYNARN